MYDQSNSQSLDRGPEISHTFVITIGSFSKPLVEIGIPKEMHVLNYLRWLNLRYSFCVVVFTDNSTVQSIVHSYGFRTEPIPSHNQNNLPVLRDILIRTREIISSKIYTYLNADILVNRHLLLTAKAIYDYHISSKQNVHLSFKSSLVVDSC